jgi:hypothetical protein
MIDIRKFPRTRHVRGSRFQSDDYDLEAAPFKELIGKHLVIEEKIDGSNCGISFSSNGELLLQSRGHYLRGGPREKQFDLLKQWASCHKETFFKVLGDRFVMYGEWMLAKHTMYYDALPHYFMEFDILDTKTNEFLSTSARKKLLVGCPISSVRVIKEGSIKRIEDLTSLITRSAFVTDDREHRFLYEAIKAGALSNDSMMPEEDEFKLMTTFDKSTDMEGLYIKAEDGDRVIGRYKYVRQSFTNSIIEQKEHWHDRVIIPNQLVPGAFEAMFV